VISSADALPLGTISVFFFFFCRDECDRMVELIKSRVRDSTFPEAHEYVKPEEIPSRNAGITHDFTGTWRSLSRDRNVPESVPLSSMRTRPGSFSQGSPLQASPELCTAAVTEAKKWLEEKRQGLGFKPEDNGPCTLNTDILSSVSINMYPFYFFVNLLLFGDWQTYCWVMVR
jgi:hypothetical protein